MRRFGDELNFLLVNIQLYCESMKRASVASVACSRSTQHAVGSVSATTGGMTGVAASCQELERQIVKEVSPVLLMSTTHFVQASVESVSLWTHLPCHHPSHALA